MWVYNRAVESGSFEEVYIATDDKRIEDTIQQHNGKSIMTSINHVSGTDRTWEAVQEIECTHIVNLQGDEPQIPIEILKEFTENCKEINDSTLLTCVSNATIEDRDNPNVVKAVLADNGDALYFSRAPIPYALNGLKAQWFKHMGIYGFTRKSLGKFCSYPPGRLEKIEKLEQLRALEMGMTIHCLVRDYETISIDTPEDVSTFKSIIGDINK